MVQPVIRDALSDEEAAICHLIKAAFQGMLYADGTEHRLVAALSAAGRLTLSLVAVVDGQPVGHVAMSPVTVGDRDCEWYILAPLAVLPSFQQQGTGSALVCAALEKLRQAGAAGCVVLGDPGYYRRFGFTLEHGLILPDVPPGYFQALAFDAGAGMPSSAVRHYVMLE